MALKLRTIIPETLGVMRVFGLLSQQYNPFVLAEYQRERLKALIEHARLRVPYYMDMVPPGTTELERLPILERQYLFDYASIFVANVLPPGHIAQGIAHSSGTTGKPVRVLQTSVTQNWFTALQLRDLEWGGVDPASKLAAIRWTEAKAIRKFRTWDVDLDRVVETGPSAVCPLSMDPREQFAWLQDFQPEVLLTYPSNLASLLEVGWVPSIRTVMTIGEPVPFDLRQAVAALGVRLHDAYSAQETGYIASECGRGKLHVHAESVIVEIVDEGNRPCPPGQFGRVLVTSLHNYSTPLMRYEIGDRAAWGSECRCGLPHPVLESVEGRVLPALALPGGGMRNPMQLLVDVRRIGAVSQFQIEERAPGLLRVHVVPRGWTAQHTERLVAAASRFYGGEGGGVEVVKCDRVPLHNGKARVVVPLSQ